MGRRDDRKLNSLGWLLAKSRLSQAVGVHPPSGFTELIRRERARADRNQEPLSLVLFSIRDIDRSPRSMPMLTCLLRKRLRMTDDLGWHRPGVLGALLPHTSKSGAMCFCDIIYAAAEGMGLDGLEGSVFIYPDAWLDGTPPIAGQRLGRLDETKKIPASPPSPVMPSKVSARQAGPQTIPRPSKPRKRVGQGGGLSAKA